MGSLYNTLDNWIQNSFDSSGAGILDALNTMHDGQANYTPTVYTGSSGTCSKLNNTEQKIVQAMIGRLGSTSWIHKCVSLCRQCYTDAGLPTYSSSPENCCRHFRNIGADTPITNKNQIRIGDIVIFPLKNAAGHATICTSIDNGEPMLTANWSGTNPEGYNMGGKVCTMPYTFINKCYAKNSGYMGAGIFTYGNNIHSGNSGQNGTTLTLKCNEDTRGLCWVMAQAYGDCFSKKPNPTSINSMYINLKAHSAITVKNTGFPSLSGSAYPCLFHDSNGKQKFGFVCITSVKGYLTQFVITHNNVAGQGRTTIQRSSGTGDVTYSKSTDKDYFAIYTMNHVRNNLHWTQYSWLSVDEAAMTAVGGEFHARVWGGDQMEFYGHFDPNDPWGTDFPYENLDYLGYLLYSLGMRNNCAIAAVCGMVFCENACNPNATEYGTKGYRVPLKNYPLGGTVGYGMFSATNAHICEVTKSFVSKEAQNHDPCADELTSSDENPYIMDFFEGETRAMLAILNENNKTVDGITTQDFLTDETEDDIDKMAAWFYASYEMWFNTLAAARQHIYWERHRDACRVIWQRFEGRDWSQWAYSNYDVNIALKEQRRKRKKRVIFVPNADELK